MTGLLDLPEEVLLEILLNVPTTVDSINLAQTSRNFWKLTASRSFWRRILYLQTSTHRAPVLRNFQHSSTEEIKCLLQDVSAFDRILKDDKLPEPKKIWTLELPECPEEIFVEENSLTFELTKSVVDWKRRIEPVLWTWMLDDAVHMLSMSLGGIMRLWNLTTKQIVLSIDVMGAPLCWDCWIDEEGITLLVNSEIENGAVETFRVWRYTWRTATIALLVRRQMIGDVRANFIRNKQMGCVGLTHDGIIYVYLVDRETLKEIQFETGFRLPATLSAATSDSELFFYAERSGFAIYYSYNLDHLCKYLGDASPATEFPHAIRKVFTFQVDTWDLSDMSFPTCKSLADGRLGVFSRLSAAGSAQGDYLTLATLDTRFNSPNEALIEARRSISRTVAGQVSVACHGDWNLYGTGTYGRAAVWMEDDGSAPSGDTIPLQNYKMCFATFADAALPLEPDSAASSTPLSTTVEVDENHTMDESGSSSTYSHSHGSESTETSSSNQGSHLEGDEEELEEDAQEVIWDRQLEAPERPLATSGHICEFELSADLARKYGGFNTVDFDDARGRVAFATGSGKILIYEFVRGE